MDILFSIISDTIIDALKLLPFLFITYIIMEALEHHTEAKTNRLIENAGHLGPLFGGLIGILPQCGFSAAASNLYAGRVISMGTLLAVYLSTSDEMLPLMISSKVPVSQILPILITKALIGIIAGFIIDALVKRYHRSHHLPEKDAVQIDKLCETEHCHCNESESIVKSALVHTFNIFFFVIIFTFILNTIITLTGEARLAAFLQNDSILAYILTGIVGLIPNCAASVIITELYIEGLISAGAMICGLLVGAGVGLLVLYRVNPDKLENIRITLILYFIGVFSGIMVDLLRIVM